MAETCPRCGVRFEREDGYWVGAVTINTAVTFITFVGLFLALTLATWPEVPWGRVMVITVGINTTLPVVFYPVAKTLWVALETSWHPWEPAEIPERSPEPT